MRLHKILNPNSFNDPNPFVQYISTSAYDSKFADFDNINLLNIEISHLLRMTIYDLNTHGWIFLKTFIFLIGIENFGLDRLRCEKIDKNCFKAALLLIRQSVAEKSLIVRNRNTSLEVNASVLALLDEACTSTQIRIPKENYFDHEQYYLHRDDIKIWKNKYPNKLEFLSTTNAHFLKLIEDKVELTNSTEVEIPTSNATEILKINSDSEKNNPREQSKIRRLQEKTILDTLPSLNLNRYSLPKNEHTGVKTFVTDIWNIVQAHNDLFEDRKAFNIAWKRIRGKLVKYDQ